MTEPQNINTDSLTDVVAGQEVAAQPQTRRSQRQSSISRRFLPRRVRRTLRKLRSNRYISYAVRGLIVAIVVAISLQVVLIVDATENLRESERRLESSLARLNGTPLTDLRLSDLETFQNLVLDSRRKINALQQRSRWVMPIVNTNQQWANDYAMLTASEHLIDALDHTLEGIRPTLFFMVAGDVEGTVNFASVERLVELLELGEDSFRQAQSDLTQADSELALLQDRLDNSDQILLMDTLRGYHAELANLNDTLLKLPDVLNVAFGLDENASYLILAQNNDEIRPSGGFIGTWGWVTVRDGAVSSFDYSASTVTSPMPPQNIDINTVYELPDWWFRFDAPIFAAWDGSWHPDFSQTAAMASWYYNNGDNLHTPVNGVIGIDLTGFIGLLEAIGEVEVPEWEQQVSAENFREVMYELREESQHKAFLADVYDAVLDQFNQMRDDDSQETQRALMQALLRALDERHIMLYMAEDELQEVVERLGWGGTQPPVSNHDYLMVVDANASPNKANQSIQRTITYDVTIRPDRTLLSRIAIDYDYSQSLAQNDPGVNFGVLDYRNLMQVIIPPGSEPVADGLDEDVRLLGVSEEDAFTRIASLFWVDYNTSERVQYSYTTPPLVEPIGNYERYRLLMQKQAGTQAADVVVQVTLPPGSQIVRSLPEYDSLYTINGLILEYRFNLNRDQWLDLLYRKP